MILLSQLNCWSEGQGREQADSIERTLINLNEFENLPHE